MIYFISNCFVGQESLIEPKLTQMSNSKQYIVTSLDRFFSNYPSHLLLANSELRRSALEAFCQSSWSRNCFQQVRFGIFRSQQFRKAKMHISKMIVFMMQVSRMYVSMMRASMMRIPDACFQDASMTR